MSFRAKRGIFSGKRLRFLPTRSKKYSILIIIVEYSLHNNIAEKLVGEIFGEEGLRGVKEVEKELVRQQKEKLEKINTTFLLVENL